MVDAALERVPLRYRFGSIYLVLALLAFAAGAAGSLELRAPTITKTVHVGASYTAGTAAQVAAAWGKPDTQVDGAQVNQALAGTVCAVYRSKKAVLCYQP